MVAGCAPAPQGQLRRPDYAPAPEVEVVEIELAGPVADRKAEVSGMAWFGEHLILLPQYPYSMGGNVYAISKGDLLAVLDGEIDGPILPRPIPLAGPKPGSLVPGYDGLEAIGFRGQQVFITIEAFEDGATGGYLIDGRINADLSRLEIDGSILTPLPPPRAVFNGADEALLVSGDSVLTFFELNGSDLVEAPVARRFQLSLTGTGAIPFPHIPYRVTDATALNDAGEFWVINYFFPGEWEIHAGVRDPFPLRYGYGATHTQGQAVERLIKLRYAGSAITLADEPPIQLRLRGDGKSRNWEGIVRIDDRGFLLITDKHPTTLLAFVPYPPAVALDSTATGSAAPSP